MYFTNRKIKEFPNHIVTEANDYGLCPAVIKSAIKINVPELRWETTRADGSKRFVQVKRIKNDGK